MGTSILKWLCHLREPTLSVPEWVKTLWLHVKPFSRQQSIYLPTWRYNPPLCKPIIYAQCCQPTRHRLNQPFLRKDDPSVEIIGSASNADGQVAGVEVSVNGGQQWHPAVGRENWHYAWHPTEAGKYSILCCAVDDSGNLERPSAAVSMQME
jgi:hypothetical protein